MVYIFVVLISLFNVMQINCMGIEFRQVIRESISYLRFGVTGSNIVNLSNISLRDIKSINKMLVKKGAHFLSIIMVPNLSITLNNNRLENLDSSIGQLIVLTHLNLSNNLFSEYPVELSPLFSLSVLNLSNNKLKAIPEEISKLSSLRSLNISYNRISEISSRISDIPLDTLDLSYNRLENLPQEFNLTKLVSLHLNNNKFKDFPKQINKLENLVTLDISRNNISVLDLADLKGLSLLIDLDLSSNELYNLLGYINKLYSLERLDLSYNNLTRVPFGIELLNFLYFLNISGNELTSFPENIRHTPKIYVIYLDKRTCLKFKDTIDELLRYKTVNIIGE